MVQNKTQIASNTHRYKKIVKKIHESQIINTSLYISKTVTCNIFDKKLIYKENWTPNTQEQVWRALLSLLYHCSIYVNVPSPNQSFYKYDFQKKLMITMLSEFSVAA